MDVELRVLNYFLMVANEGNITKAAQLLHITQPSLSRQLMQLEDELGVKLFRRSSHSIVLTDEGLLLKRRAQELLFLAAKTKCELRTEKTISGVISIGSGEYKCSSLFAEAIAAFRREHPLVQFELYSGNSDNIKEQIEQGSLDLGLLVEPVEIGKYDFLRLPVKEEWGILAKEDSELAQNASVSPQDIVHMPLMFGARELVQNEIRNWFGSFAEEVEIVATCNLQYNLAELVRSGVGIYIGLHLNCEYGSLRFVPLSPPLQSGTVLVWKKSEPRSAAVNAFITHMEQYLKNIAEI